MDFPKLLEAAYFRPNRLVFPDSWIGHIPFAAWLTQTLKPSIFVELGTHSGNSYMAFCQAVKEGGLSTRCYSIDTWKGDKHAGFYGEEIYSELSNYHEQHYSSFSRLLRMTFDEGVSYFGDGSIELLHIDGLHTYEAVKHDFTTWLPKLSPHAIVLFHDTNVRERDFGIWRYWQEICLQYPLNFEFVHAHGLGVLQLSIGQGNYNLAWLKPEFEFRKLIIDYFANLGSLQLEIYHKREIENSMRYLREEFNKIQRELQNNQAMLAEGEQHSAVLEAQLTESEQNRASLRAQFAESEQNRVILRGQLAASEQRAVNIQKQLTEIEQQSNELLSQLNKSQQEVSTKSTQNAGLQQELTSLRNHLNEREAILQKLNNTLLEIYSSTAWKIIKRLWRVRVWMVPRGSRRERVVYSILNLFQNRQQALDTSDSQRISTVDASGVQNTSSNQVANVSISQYQDKTIEAFPIGEVEKFERVYEKLMISARGEKDREYVNISDIDLSQEELPVKLISFYLPQFHPIPENDAWWGKGFTEWTNVSKAIPQFEGHYQPHLPGELGFYDLRVPEIQQRQVELAKKYGIYGFCFYYYWFNGKRLLERPLNQYINDPEINFPFCICWANENWSRRWDGRSEDILISQEHSFEYDKKFIHDIAQYFTDPRYIHIGKKPLIIVYRPDIIQDAKATLEYWREYCENKGMGKPYIIAAQTFGYFDPRADGFDAAVNFPPHDGTSIPEITQSLYTFSPKYSGRVYKFIDFANLYMDRINVKPYRHFNTVSPGWDNEPRRSGCGTTFTGTTPEIYAKWLETAARFVLANYPEEEQVVFINAWNEWGEGAYLEPDRRFGYAYLQATAEVINKIDSLELPLNIFPSSFPSQKNASNHITIRYNNIIQSWPWFTIIPNETTQREKTKLLHQLSSDIDNFLSTKVVNGSTRPIVSVVIPVHNHFEDTLNCLKSFRDTNEKYSYEIIVIDDGSTDETNDVMSKCKNIHYLKNDRNLGYLQSCNRAAQFALGEYLILVNNDVCVLPGWLDALVDTFLYHPDAGLVGSKLIYPDGHLQEAGGVIWEDASGINFGRDDDANKPEYNYLREVDYCSGACICVPKSLWDELKGFDPLYIPAYYEDVDLAFRLRKQGYRVLYQPFSQVIHLEGITSGTDITQGIKKFQEVNKLKFYDRWKEALVAHGDYSQTEIGYRNRIRKARALVIDVCTPKPDHDAGSIETYHYLLMLRSIGYEVTFISVVDAHIIDNYVFDLQKKGIECIYQPYLESIEEYISKMGKYFDLVFLFRAPFGGKYIDRVREFAPKAKIVFHTIDLHSLREQREREIAGYGKGDSLLQEGVTTDNEILIMEKADQTIVVSDYEQDWLNSLEKHIQSRVIPLTSEIPGCETGFEGRKNILFIGGYLHKPNVDAVLYFTKEIWPLISRELPDCEFWVVGSNVPNEIEELASEHIKIIGFVEDLKPIFENCKMSVAPIRYGAGIKGKILTSLSFGVPCVATPIAVEGMGLTHGQNVMVGSTPEEYARYVADLYSSCVIWENLSRNGLEFVQDKYSLDVLKNSLKRLVDDLHIRS
jgi:GT2 family glycosyltransferase